MPRETVGIGRTPQSNNFRPRPPETAMDVLRCIYYSPFHWSLVKSVSLFIVGIAVARSLGGLEIDKPISV
ncbi:hypothetical protein TTRE_0000128801 [Trichuris trichiura]|uniref:Uncharacterized protein n=1 Tax=Trichuris trichiura TaxID=36087 RepID=A0A077Z2T8_TRITR|nr:hypothetical protein TTRE_0000128801 [Trichuris trichiura]